MTDHDTLQADIGDVAAPDLDLGSDWKALYPFACRLVHFVILFHHSGDRHVRFDILLTVETAIVDACQ